MNRGLLGAAGRSRPSLRGQVILGDRSTAISTGIKGQIELPACELKAIRWVGDQVGSITIDIYALPIAKAIAILPTSAHSILMPSDFVVTSLRGKQVSAEVVCRQTRFDEPMVFYANVVSASTVTQGTLILLARERETL